MGVSRRVLSGALVAAGLMPALPAVGESQVGISSGTVLVALVAQVPPRASIQEISAAREAGRMGTLREASVVVRISANTGYRLMVRLADGSSSRIWVKSVTGVFQELAAGSSATVAGDTRCAGQCEREVQYRIESDGDLSLPVRYELWVSPLL